GGFDLGVDKQVIGQTHALPAMVAVHGEVSAHNAGQPPCGTLHGALELFEKAKPALRIGVSSISKGVDKHIPESFSMRCSQDGNGVADVRVNASVGNQPDEVECTTRRHRILEGVVKYRIGI